MRNAAPCPWTAKGAAVAGNQLHCPKTSVDDHGHRLAEAQTKASLFTCQSRIRCGVSLPVVLSRPLAVR